MAQTTVRCPHCKETHPVFLKDLGKVLYCPVRQAQFRLARLGSVYILLDVLGNGAFGIVYRAYDLQNQREVALKQLNDKAVPEHEFDSWIKRAVTEARALAKIDFHPNVLPLYTSGHVGKQFFMVTPIIRGQTLEKLIPEGGFPKPQRAVQLAVTILRALEHVHAFKVYHRDVKPSNVMIDVNGNLFLLDFGLAACRQIDTSLHTQMGTVLGTPAFMPPEQARGEINRVGPWSDQYGAGVVLFKMLTGHVPYPGKGYAVLSDVADYNKPPLPVRHFRPGLHPTLEGLVMRSLAKFPGDRFPSCALFAEHLQAWSDAQSSPQLAEIEPLPPAPQPPPSPPPPAAVADEPPRTRWVLWTTVALAAVMLAAGACYLVWQYTAPPPATQPTPQWFEPTKK